MLHIPVADRNIALAHTALFQLLRRAVAKASLPGHYFDQPGYFKALAANPPGRLNLSRRLLLSDSALTIGAIALRHLQSLRSVPNPMIAVIGGSLAGLTAAYILQK